MSVYHYFIGNIRTKTRSPPPTISGEAIGHHLCNSDSVTLDGIGTFKVGMQTKPAKEAPKNLYGKREKTKDNVDS